MSSVLHSLGFVTDTNLDIFVLCTVFSVGVVTALWVIGLFQPSHSMIDGWY